MKRIAFTGGHSARGRPRIPRGRSRTRSPSLRAELAKQQVVIAQLLKRIDALEKQQPPAAAAAAELQDDIKAQEDSVNSLREIVNSKVNLNGYYNFRFSRRRVGRAGGLSAAPSRRADGEAARQVQLPDGARAAERAASPGNCRRTSEEEEHDEEAGEHAEARHQRRRTGGRRERVDGIQSQPPPQRPRRQAAVAAVLVAEPLSEPDALDRARPSISASCSRRSWSA